MRFVPLKAHLGLDTRPLGAEILAVHEFDAW